MIALIVLVAMTLAGLALIRSVDTTNIIAGNLGFQQSATHSGDIGTETAIAWLETNNTGITLQNDNINSGYFAARGGRDPAANQSWDNYWTTVLDPTPAATPVTSAVASGQRVDLAHGSGHRQHGFLLDPASLQSSGRSSEPQYRLRRLASGRDVNRQQQGGGRYRIAIRQPDLLSNHNAHHRTSQYRELYPDDCRLVVVVISGSMP